MELNRIVSKPFFSIITPSYNSINYICRCVDSVLHQSFGDWEMVIVNDGSTDGSTNILNSYAKRDSRIKVFYQNNTGFTNATNKCLSLAKGDYIISVDSDNWLSDKNLLEKLRSYIEIYSPDVIQFPIMYINEERNAAPVYIAMQPFSFIDGFNGVCDNIRKQIIYTHTHGGKAIRRSIVSGVKLYGDPCGADSRFMNRVLLDCTTALIIDEPFLCVEGRKGSLSHINHDVSFYYQWIMEESKYLPDYLAKYNVTKMYFPQIEWLFDLFKTTILKDDYNKNAIYCGKILWKYRKLFYSGNNPIMVFIVFRLPFLYKKLKRDK